MKCEITVQSHMKPGDQTSPLPSIQWIWNWYGLLLTMTKHWVTQTG